MVTRMQNQVEVIDTGDLQLPKAGTTMAQTPAVRGDEPRTRPAGNGMIAFEDALGELALIDHHVHGALADEVTGAEVEMLITESDRALPSRTTTFDSQLGFAIRRWCAPELDLPAHASAADYLARRAELGNAEVNRLFVSACGVSDFLIDTGYGGGTVLGVSDMARISGVSAHEVVRLEALAEQVAGSGVDAAGFAASYAEALARRSAEAVGLKTIIAYRLGLDFDPEPPSPPEVEASAGAWLRTIAAGAPPRLTDPVLLRHVIWAGIETGLPLQIHVGFGDPDVRLHRGDPLSLTGFIELVEPRGVPLLLLHCYPFQRAAGCLAAMYPHVYFDVGLALNYVGSRASEIVAETLEVAPFAKILYSSDAWGPAKLHYLGALRWRRAMAAVLGAWIEAGEWARADAERVASMIGRDNARRVYRLDA